MVLSRYFPRPTGLIKLLGLLALTSTLMGVTGCVSVDEHKRLQTAFDESRRQLAEAENDLTTLRSRVSDLESQIAAKDALMGGAGSGADALRNQRDLLAAQLAELRDKYNKLLETAGSPALPTPVNDALRRLAEQYPDLLEFDESRGLVRFKSDLTFDLGSTEVKPRAKEALAQFAKILNFPDIVKNEVRIVGNTDDVPIRGTKSNVMNPTNWQLSTNRAISVLFVLRDDGVNQMRLQPAGWGENRPIAPNAPGRRGNEKNRRVDIYILPTTAPEGITVSTGGEMHSSNAMTPVKHKHKSNGGTMTPVATPTEPAVPTPVNQ